MAGATDSSSASRRPAGTCCQPLEGTLVRSSSLTTPTAPSFAVAAPRRVLGAVEHRGKVKLLPVGRGDLQDLSEAASRNSPPRSSQGMRASAMDCDLDLSEGWDMKQVMTDTSMSQDDLADATAPVPDTA
jgi:hypothetical protein